MLPTLNITVYTDYPDWLKKTVLDLKGGFADLEAFVKEKTKKFVDVQFTFVSRHGETPTKLITKELLTEAHELWVFGHRMNDKLPKEPDNKLKESEIELLQEFIGAKHRVGIFLTGDHSESEVGAKCEDGGHEQYSSLGRALGENIPIAGLFRDWEGPPTNCNEGEFDLRDTFNTQEGSNPCSLDAPGLESDVLAQNIILTIKNCLPHRLFTYFDSSGNPQPITKLPDHTHEGRVLDVEEVRERLGDKWRKDWDDIVVVAAKGRDKRFPDENRISNLVVALDGDSLGRSRMVVDSSFHHYLDFNLFAIRRRAEGSRLPEPGSDLDQIAEYFGNLALWLAPKPIRDHIKYQLLLSLTRHMAVRQVWNHSVVKVGTVARDVLKRTVSSGKLQWLVGEFPFEKRDPLDELLSVVLLGNQHDSLFSQIIKPELSLGVALRLCDHFLTSNQISDFTQVVEYQSLWKLLQTTFFVALDVVRTDLVKQSPIPSAVLENSLASFKQSKGEKTMAFKCEVNWTSILPFSADTDDGEILVDEVRPNGDMRGRHRKNTQEKPVTGRCRSGPDGFQCEREGFKYNGEIFDVGNTRIVVGHRLPAKAVNEREGGKKVDGEEVWVGVKTT